MKQINKIIVVGGGTSGILSVYYILKNFPNISIKWIFPNNNDTIGVGEATIPYVHNFLCKLGLDYNVLIKNCSGSLKLGLNFEDFLEEGNNFFHSFGDTFSDFFINENLMKNNLIDENLLKNHKNYALHFDIKGIFDYLYAEINNYKNIEIIRANITDINVLDYKITSIGTDISIEKYDADLFIDCTGFKKLLINSLLKDNFINYENKILNNTSLVYRDSYTNLSYQQKSYTKCKAMDYGWIWHIPLSDKLSIGYVHNNKYDVKNDFFNYLESIFGKGKVNINNIRRVNFIIGRNKKHIYNNIFCVGLSSSFIEPLESTGLYFVSKNIEYLGEFINGNITENEINSSLNDDFDSVLNFIIGHYKFSNRNNEYWNFYKNIDISLYKSSNLFGIGAWYCILNGLEQRKLLDLKFGDKVKYYELLKRLKMKYVNSNISLKYNEWIKTNSLKVG